MSCPTTIPTVCAARLRTRYPISIDRALGLGHLPNARLQRALAGVRGVGALNRFLTWVHWLWFLEPYCALLYILIRHPARFPRAARRLAAVFDAGCVVYFAAPTAPPWWSSQEGLTGEPVRRIMEEVGRDFWGGAWERMYGALGGNPVGGDALAALRDVAGRRRLARRSRAVHRGSPGGPTR